MGTQKSVYLKINFLISQQKHMLWVLSCFSYFSTKAYVVGTQKNRLNEMVLLSTQNFMFKLLDTRSAVAEWLNACL